ncbi:hypothetical protein [Pararobbsia silviterrae]|uniref:DUF2244 domain-containing protein n=1 Tax=Pararobbsia silviterrae TaxID=1792498 RepID=A0A494XBV1_9BURK|nr:hypothetical protein [Pararobbsia silviterrae]RKP47111.1 hypothetical protein D7S86_23470 [Pararobbsia silviterrae]
MNASHESKPARPIWRIPLVLAFLTCTGLLAALLGNGLGWRGYAWACLATPIVVMIRYACFARE